MGRNPVSKKPSKRSCYRSRREVRFLGDGDQQQTGTHTHAHPPPSEKGKLNQEVFTVQTEHLWGRQTLELSMEQNQTNQQPKFQHERGLSHGEGC